MSDQRIIWAPQPRQKLVLECPYDEILYGGAAGAGKSDCLIGDFLKHASEHGKNARGVIFRRTNREANELWRRAYEIFTALGASVNKEDRILTLPDGAALKITYLDSWDDALGHRGFEYTWIGRDELTLWSTDEEFFELKTRLRSPAGVAVRELSTTNPGGPGHQWVLKRYLIDQYPNGMVPIHTYLNLKEGKIVHDGPKGTHEWDKFKKKELPEGIKRKTRIFIPGRLKDNVYLDRDGEYRANLLSKSEMQRKMLLDGRWDVVEGAFFSEWEPSVHVVRAFTPPRQWKRWCGMDWGTGKPYCVGWYAESPDGSIYKYRELYGMDADKPNVGNRRPARLVAQDIRRIESEAEEFIVERYADNSIFIDEGVGVTVADQFAKEGVIWQPAKKAKKAGGISMLREMLAVTNGYCRLKFMDTCVHSIRTIPALQVDRNNPDQYDSDGEDHAADETLYALRKNVLSPDEIKAQHSIAASNRRKTRACVPMSPG